MGAADFAITSRDVTVGWLPLYHDMGLVNQIFEPLFFPHHSVLMSPTAWLREPYRLLELGVDDILDGLTSRPAQLQRVLEGHLAAARRYAPTPYAGRVVLFRTPQRLLQAPEPDMGWSRLSTEPVDVQMIAGSHGTILEEPHVRVLAEKLRIFLPGADGAIVGLKS